LSFKTLAGTSMTLDPQRLPTHVAIIMDGNGRWAKKRFLNRVNGHEKGADTVRMVVRTCRELGIPFLTLYAFSTENWQRPKAEVAALMTLLNRFLKSERNEMLSQGIRLNTIGQTDRLPDDTRRTLMDVISATRHNGAMTLNLALSYGGRDEILNMVQQVARGVQSGQISPQSIDEQTVAQFLYTKNMPDPDIVIRTSGEMRLSNFLLWQVAYSEIFVTPTLWPDFSREELLQILQNFQNRDRRFGKVGD